MDHKPFITTGATIGCILALSLSLGAILLVAILGNHTDTRNCRAALDVRDAMVTIIQDAQDRVNGSPAQTITEHQRKEASAFYERSLSKLKGVQCG